MKTILGISAGRKNKVTESVVEAVLTGAKEYSSADIDYELISLSGKLIRPCEACNGCVNTNKCILKDDFPWIMDKMIEADAIVFGAPTYWNHMNAKGQAFWERACFLSRHNAVFLLKDKPGGIVAIDGKGTDNYVIRDLKEYYQDARIKYTGSVTAQGEYACFTCGYGSFCSVGGFAELYPLGTEITDDLKPSANNQHPETTFNKEWKTQSDKNCKKDNNKRIQDKSRTIIPEAKQLGAKITKMCWDHH
ncbi:flavodoxin family protein [Natranaerobius thermophilus]|uniref:Multimeric flavodoxin WrbA-like protein n=1 Tax=Natranaerobius thermophilus (strain ATCC BAA-1301 / DSM 18059 / JW/NM-WN-LF) TaxID=457570 RepID=B2A7B6_NATTJ|nr:flavodoxin family protein [Natranaerobius thermophilus]ACB84310.1 Multimeric flavodoxin WrbA-like protein [Natranaerobius thermophilus JW/NM-WN-LF]